MPKNTALLSDGLADPRLVVLTCEELADFLKLPSVETVYQWRRKRTGPEGFRAGRHVRYTLASVLAWMDSQARQDAA
ncbi:helix-turn-helix transcriptional regulator [Kitasatospora azatica]|uniref:helix-turn-helix transcriptional regulator n=1 Tax=Kitasatospora azatica TaxID=58347 RepID=UPI00055F181C|nr:helix-turn-helix domain-containing protein [Kitasatospora azatica]